MSEYVSTREAATRLGYSIGHVRKVLASKGVAPLKHSPHAHPRWYWPAVSAAFHEEQNCAESQRNAVESEIPS